MLLLRFVLRFLCAGRGGCPQGRMHSKWSKSVRKKWGLARQDAVPVPIFSERSKESIPDRKVHREKGDGPLPRARDFGGCPLFRTGSQTERLRITSANGKRSEGVLLLGPAMVELLR